MERTAGENLRAPETRPETALLPRAGWLRALALASSLWAGAASAATISVDTEADGLVGCTLRAAVQSANDNFSYNGCTAGTGDDVVDLSAIAGRTITLSQGANFGEIQIDSFTNDSLIIEGAGVTIDGNDSSRIFRIDADATLRNLTLSGGLSDVGDFGGGAVYAAFGVAEIENTTLRDNRSNDAVGGGAILVGGTLILRDSVLFDNSAAATGGAIFGGSTSNITLINTTLWNNTATRGGGLDTGGSTVTLVHSTLSRNTATTGGALASRNDTVTITNSILANSIGGDDCFAQVTSTITLTGVNLIESQSTCAASSPDLIEADPQLNSLGLNGGPTVSILPQAGSPVIDAGSDAEVPVGLDFDQRGPGFVRIAGFGVDLGSIEVQDVVQPGPDFVVTSADDTDDGTCRQFPGHCSLREAVNAANANADASGISFDGSLLTPAATITLTGAQLPVVTTEVSILGGGITVDGDQQSRLFSVGSGGTLTLDQFTLTDGFDAVFGGAIDVGNGSALVLRNSTVSNSQSGFGGAVSAVAGSVQLVNSTLTGNTATTAGGGIWASGSTVEIVHGTLSGNTSSGGAIFMSAGSATLTNSIIANTIGGADCLDGGGSYTLNGVNLVENRGDCGMAAGPGLIEGTDPALGPLADNGGPTPTLRPLPASPVIDAGDASANPVGLDYDQRGPGFLRLRDAGVDLGSVEVQFADPDVIFLDGYEGEAGAP